MVKTGRCGLTFEELLRVSPATVLDRSRYESQLRHLLQCIARERVHVMLLEEFVRDKETQMRRLLEFLQLPFDDLPAGSLETRANPARLPKYVGLQRLLARAVTSTQFIRYAKCLPNPAPSPQTLSKVLVRAHRKLNPLIERRPPELLPATRKRLEDYFLRELEGLDEVIGRPVMQEWFPVRAE
jgi:hypothetical protein